MKTEKGIAYKLQSAMEYLLTYGWALVVISVVLGVLYSMGLFSTKSIARQSCAAIPGFECNYPILNGTGSLKVLLGSTNELTLTGVGCTGDSAAPPALTEIAPVEFYPGSAAIILFACPLPANVLGTPFSGYLWIGYNTITASGQEEAVAQVSASVATLEKVA